MIVTLQSHFDQPIGLDLCKYLVNEVGIECFRLSMFNATREAIQESMMECLDANGDFILLTEDHEVMKMCQRVKIEHMNEPNGRIPINEVHEHMMKSYEICKENNNTLLTPCISNTNQDSIEWLQKFTQLGVPDDVIISYHTYRPGLNWKDFFNPGDTDSPDRPHKGFNSRDGEMKWLKLAAGPRQLWCTENGYNKDDPQFQAEQLQYELKFAERHGIMGYTYYQLNDDPNIPEPFGLRDKDFNWKQPLVDVLKNWKATHAQS